MRDVAIRPNNQTVELTADEVREYLKYNPAAAEGWRAALRFMASIKSWADIEREVFGGLALSARTREAYVAAARDLFAFMDGQTPYQTTVGHLELFADHLAKRGAKQATIAARMYALKKYMARLAQLSPGWIDPFSMVSVKLHRKLFKTKAPRCKTALSADELHRVLPWLRENDGEAYGIYMLLLTTGLRASEATAARWSDVQEGDDGAMWLTGRGKGGKDFALELLPEVLAGLKRRGEYIIMRGAEAHNRQSLHYVVAQAGKRLEAAGIVSAGRRLAWSPHLLRRSLGTYLAKLPGTSLKAVAGILRHSNIATTAAHYVDDVLRVGLALAGLFGEVAA